MLKELTIRNFAIIEDITLEFTKGMSVFLGETGAGKSIIINALALLVGQRAQSSYIRDGQSRAFVEAVIELDKVEGELSEFKLDDNRFIFTRIINLEGNNVCKINGMNVTINTLKNTLGRLVNIHSQHDTYYLLDERFHLSLLDKFNFEKINDLKDKYRDQHSKYNNKVNYYNKLSQSRESEDVDYLKFQLDEIESLDLKENEIEELDLEVSRIKKFQKISETINLVSQAMNGENGILELLYETKKNMATLSDDPIFVNDADSLEELYSSAYDIYETIKGNYDSLDLDENKLSSIEDRLYKINKIKRKFGNGYVEIQAAKEEFVNKINYLENKEETLLKLQEEIKSLKNSCLIEAKKLSEHRKKTASKLKNSIEKELKDLHLDKTIFEVDFSPISLNEEGIDRVEFMLSTNVGESLKPLAKVASGGETSRLTLGLNVIFNEMYGVKLSIFDEVDVGIGGKTATSVGNKLKQLSTNYQMIVISHSPQIISKGDTFYFVDKKVENNKTKTIVKILNNEEKIFEIARILSGSDSPSQLFIENAKELIK